MLYSLYEAQHLALAPARFMAELSRGWFGNPFSPWAYTPFSKRLAASSDLFLRVTQRYEKPAWNIDADIEVALDKPFCKLLHFNTGASRSRKVLVVAPLSGHHATLLRDTVRALLADHDVWVTDWIDARKVPLSRGAVPFRRLRRLRARVHPLPRPGRARDLGVPADGAGAGRGLAHGRGRARRSPRTLTMMGGPIDARRSPTAVNNFATRKPLSWFEAKVIQRVPMRYPGFMRRVYPGFLQFAGFVAMNPDRHMDSHVQYYQHLVEGDGESADAHRRFYDEYNAVMDLPAEYYLETVERVFQKHPLPQGKLVRGRARAARGDQQTRRSSPSRASSTTSPATARPRPRTRCARASPPRAAALHSPGVGHYGIFSGRRWREMIYPEVREFIARFS